MKMQDFFKKVSKYLPSRSIERRDGKLYLTRYYIFRKPVSWMPSIYLHEFHSSDEDSELHSHPWKYSVSFLLYGRYKEYIRGKRGVESRILKSGDINFVAQNKFHRVDLLTESVWTLFISGPKVSDWGFWNQKTGEYLPWREHIRRKGQ